MYYSLRLAARNIATAAGGAATPIINKSAFSAVEIAVPCHVLQKRIADVMSAFDDLIESNRRRIEILNETLRSLYREWFVYYRFPGHVTADFVGSPVGLIPDDWAAVGFSDLATFVNGFAFKPIHLQNTGVPIIKIKELKNGVTASTPRYPGNDIKEKYRVSPGDLLFSWSGDLEAYLWGGPDGWLNQHLFRVDEVGDISRSWLYAALRDRMHEFRLRSQGTTMKHIQRSALSQVQVARPAFDLFASFDAQAGAIVSLLITLQQTEASVVAARDLLLPKLVTGQIVVDSLGVDDVFGWTELAEEEPAG